MSDNGESGSETVAMLYELLILLLAGKDIKLLRTSKKD